MARTINLNGCSVNSFVHLPWISLQISTPTEENGRDIFDPFESMRTRGVMLGDERCASRLMRSISTEGTAWFDVCVKPTEDLWTEAKISGGILIFSAEVVSENFPFGMELNTLDVCVAFLSCLVLLFLFLEILELFDGDPPGVFVLYPKSFKITRW
mmetsp:Transcript_10863/g.16195  ORF Transcript_10863/g.16195 Transcript_10863/m.16195 type:complete len:156 (+) Transcript_10863:149-616(+)